METSDRYQLTLVVAARAWPAVESALSDLASTGARVRVQRSCVGEFCDLLIRYPVDGAALLMMEQIALVSLVPVALVGLLVAGSAIFDLFVPIGIALALFSAAARFWRGRLDRRADEVLSRVDETLRPFAAT